MQQIVRKDSIRKGEHLDTKEEKKLARRIIEGLIRTKLKDLKIDEINEMEAF